MAPHEETVLARIARVTESRTRPDWKHPGGRRRFEIDAVRVADPTMPVWCSTLDQFAASLCLRARETQIPLLLTIRMVTLHGRFGATSNVFNLVHVEQPNERVSA